MCIEIYIKHLASLTGKLTGKTEFKKKKIEDQDFFFKSKDDKICSFDQFCHKENCVSTDIEIRYLISVCTI